MTIIAKSTSYIKESIEELKKVTWPSRADTISHSLLVIGLSAVMAVFLGAIDYLLSLGVEKLIIN
ncbi:MAG: hypothetical protein G01um101418_849 [Parcubacteria group bacterium Gr01-1014_18]|nr:MAG: hypothetical protein Greene041636_809 [Parcubacteria group bacterium Greene0416_36]TSC79850.1 MAG: hypothetical protein G01um101418_849 [Parcubacteria group bacterium Gr01-1014_18]TSC98282.1 MAG: hypothetical protein Greene101420_786 [Parcubacteria group bacterium Greene1014_20]TSD06678.1 MAG: hypothetical protein Greene07142_730 [Parcubacteria group bacterium Greene0714_2]